MPYLSILVNYRTATRMGWGTLTLAAWLSVSHRQGKARIEHQDRIDNEYLWELTFARSFANGLSVICSTVDQTIRPPIYPNNGERVMATSPAGTTVSTSDWGSDFFGTLNEMLPEPVLGIGHTLEAMSTLPAFRNARHWGLQNLGISQGSSVMEAGGGNVAAQPDILAAVGSKSGVVV